MSGHHGPYDADFKRSVVEYYLDNHTSIDTAEHFHVSRRAVTVWVTEAGQEVRPKGYRIVRDSAMRIHRNGAAKVAKKAPTPPPSPVTVAELSREIKRQLPRDVSRVQVLNPTTVIVWNSLAQKRALQKDARRNYA